MDSCRTGEVSRPEHDSPVSAAMVGGGEGGSFQLPVWAQTTHTCHVGVEATLDRESHAFFPAITPHLALGSSMPSFGPGPRPRGIDMLTRPAPSSSFSLNPAPNRITALLFWWVVGNAIVNGTVPFHLAVDGLNPVPQFLPSFCVEPTQSTQASIIRVDERSLRVSVAWT